MDAPAQLEGLYPSYASQLMDEPHCADKDW